MRLQHRLLSFHTGSWRAPGKEGDSGLRPAPLNSPGNLGAPASHASHGWPSKWLRPASWLAPAPTSVAICLHLPSLGLAATCPPARPPALPCPPPPLRLAHPSLLTALALQVLNNVGREQVTELWAGVSGISRSCWEDWTRDLKGERLVPIHTESRQKQAGLLLETGSPARLRATPGPLHMLVPPPSALPLTFTRLALLSACLSPPHRGSRWTFNLSQPLISLPVTLS